MDFVGLEYQGHLVIAADLAFVSGILEFMAFDVLPDFLDDLGSGELFRC